MRGTILVTEGGPHPPEDWANATADQIVSIAEGAPGTLAAEGRQFRDELVRILGRYFARVQRHERDQLKEHSHARLMQDPGLSEHVKDPVGAVVATASDYSFGEYFQKPETQDYVRRVLEKDMGSAVLIERSWHADAHHNTKEAKAFRAMHHPGPDKE